MASRKTTEVLEGWCVTGSSCLTGLCPMFKHETRQLLPAVLNPKKIAGHNISRVPQPCNTSHAKPLTVKLIMTLAVKQAANRFSHDTALLPNKNHCRAVTRKRTFVAARAI